MTANPSDLPGSAAGPGRPLPAEPNPSAPPRGPSWVFVAALAFIVYNVNFRWIHTADSIPARVQPFSLLMEHSLYLDAWVKPYLPADGRSVYYAVSERGHTYSRYPIVLPLVISPLYVPPAWWLARQQPPLAPNNFLRMTLVNTMEKLAASLIAALSVGLLYLGLTRLATRRAALAISAAYALASTTWTISSQALWRHGLTELCLAGLLAALASFPASPRAPFWAGLAIALAAANKPAYAVFAVLFFVFFWRSARKRALLYALPVAVIGALVFAYNFLIFHRLLGAYPEPAPLPVSGPGVGLRVDPVAWWDAPLGLLVSPSRGLFIYVPWTLLAVWGALRAWKAKPRGWERHLVAGAALLYLIHARLGSWWAGVCYGPRYLTELLPLMAFFLVPIWERVCLRRAVRAAFILALAAGLWVEVVGAFYYPYGDWDNTPAPVDYHPHRVWDLQDSQIVRCFRAGPAHPQLLYEWYVVYKQPGAWAPLPEVSPSVPAPPQKK